MDQNHNLETDSMPNWQPIQLPYQRCDMTLHRVPVIKRAAAFCLSFQQHSSG